MASACPLQSRADCDANFDLIRSWISQCEQHPICTRVPLFAPESRLPTRLIDIGTGSDDDAPRLVISADLEDTADCRYVALSHCWGDPRKIQVPKTLRNTLEDHQKRITTLSKTFEDAIEVARQIGVRYIWIDSLCIIQDESEDFKKECSRMSLVYARAYCVLSALDAEDGSRGLFIPRGSSTQPSQIFLNDKQWQSMLNGPLSTRGWAFQEHELSPRIIHFTKFRILWECRVCVASEDFPSQRYRALFGERLDTAWRLFDGQHERYDNKIERQTDRRDMHTRWLRAAEVYSSRNLTYETDKLPAISGLAAAVAAVLTEDGYLGGLWKNDLARGLMWRAAPFGAEEISDRISSIPSWSWASFGGSIRFLQLEDMRTRFLYGIMETLSRDERSAKLIAYTNASNLNPFGEVKGGTLQITAPMKNYDIGPQGNIKCGMVDRDALSLDISLDNPSIRGHHGLTFAVLSSRWVNGPGSFFPIFGLILKKSGPNIYERIGVFHSKDIAYEFFNSFKLDTVTVE